MSVVRSPTRHASEDIESINNGKDKENDIPSGIKTPGSSCRALRHAVSNLYRIDDFVCENLGSGYFSTVYKVNHKVTNEVMVLKMNTNLNNRPNMLREVQLMNRLKHPNVLRFIGVCVHEGQLHALTEFINGGSLDILIQDTNVELSWTERFSLGTDISRGMKYLHSRQIMHRDLTSRNVLVRTESNNVRTAIVADFGLSTTIPDPLDVNSERMQIVGSPYWMAPECIHGQRYNEKADVFSFGIILCEIIARIDADPDILPRTSNFGIDYVAFSKMAESCPLHFIHLTFHCCQFESKKRPSFQETTAQMEEMRTRSKMASVLMDINKLTVNSDKEMDKSILDRIIIGRGLKRNMSDDAITMHISDDYHRGYYTEVEDCTSSSSSSQSDNEEIEETPVNTPQPNDTTATTTPDKEGYPVTPLMVGEVMSKDDPFYTPHRNNPFPSRFKDASAKVIGSLRENWQAWFDLPSPRNFFTPSITPKSGHEDSNWVRPVTTPKLRRSHSLPGSPYMSRKEIDRFQYETANYSPSGYKLVPPTGGGGYPSARKPSEPAFGATNSTSSTIGFHEEAVESHSDGSSSADSAVDLMLRDMKRSRKKLVSGRKLSMEMVAMRAGEGCVSRAEIYTRYLEAKILDDALNRKLGVESKGLNLHDVHDKFPHSFSSSESCLSLDECSMLSPTSSYSSYSEEPELWSRAQFEFYEHRLRSREKFQELVRRFEAKQQAASVAAKKGEQSNNSSSSTPRNITQPRSLFLHERLEHSDAHLERKFQELRRKWENKEQPPSMSSLSSLHHTQSCQQRLSPKPHKHTSKSSSHLHHGAKPKVKTSKQLSPRSDKKNNPTP